jgi:cell division septation protein DedD
LRQALGPAENAAVASSLWQIAQQQPPNRPESLLIRQLAIGHLQLARQLGGDQLRIDNVPIGELIQRMQASLGTNAASAPPAAAPQKPSATGGTSKAATPATAAKPKSQPTKSR